MAAGATSRILLCASEPAAVDDVRRVLEQAGHTVVCQPLAAAGAEGGMLCDLVILDSSRHAPSCLRSCQRKSIRRSCCAFHSTPSFPNFGVMPLPSSLSDSHAV